MLMTKKNKKKKRHEKSHCPALTPMEGVVAGSKAQGRRGGGGFVRGGLVTADSNMDIMITS
jgi:hypothetical protein